MTTRAKAESMILDLMVEHKITPQSLIDAYIDRKYPDANPKLLNVQQAMKALNMSRSTLYRKMDEGMPYYKKDNGKRGRFFDIKACKDYLRTKERTAQKLKENKHEINEKKNLTSVNLVKKTNNKETSN